MEQSRRESKDQATHDTPLATKPGAERENVQLRSMGLQQQQSNLRPKAPVQLKSSNDKSGSSKNKSSSSKTKSSSSKNKSSSSKSTSGASKNKSSSSKTKSSSSKSTSGAAKGKTGSTPEKNTSEKVDKPKHKVFSHAKAGTGAEIQAILDSGIANRDQINTMLNRSTVKTAVLLKQKCTEFGNWTHVGLYFGTEADYATAMGPQFAAAMNNLDTAKAKATSLPPGGSPTLNLALIDYMEQDLITKMTAYAPPSLTKKVEKIWPKTNHYRTQWSQAIQANITETNTLASNIQADPATYWPTTKASKPLPGHPFYVKAWGIARSTTQPIWGTAWQGLEQKMAQVIQTAVADANTHSASLIGGAALQPETFYAVRDRLNLVLERSGTQRTSVDQALSKLSGIEAVRTDSRIQPHATEGNYMIPPGELHLYVNEGAGKGRSSFAATSGQAAPTEKEIKSFISRRDVIQGGLADCFLVAVLSSVADTNPSLIANAITEPSPGTFNVKLHTPVSGWGPPPGGTFQQVTISVNHEIPHVDNRGQTVSGVATLRETIVRNGLLQKMRITAPDVLRELWVVIMEKALAKAYPNGYRSIGNGGHSNVVFQMLTGQAANYSNLPAPTAGDAAKDTSWNALNAHVTANRPATAGSDAMRIINAASSAGIIAGLKAGRAKDKKVFDALAGTPGTLDSLISDNKVPEMRDLAKKIYKAGQSPVQSATMGPIGRDAQVYAWHAYSIIATREVHDPAGTSKRFVKLRNPWGVVTSDRGNFGEFELTYDEFLNRYGNITLGNFNTGTP